jgi:hypothetical protein
VRVETVDAIESAKSAAAERITGEGDSAVEPVSC